jgi:hypothetical protein
MGKYWWLAAALLFLIGVNLAVIFVPRMVSAPQENELAVVDVPDLSRQATNDPPKRGSGTVRQDAAIGGKTEANEQPIPMIHATAGLTRVTVDNGAGPQPVVVFGGIGAISPELRAELEELRRNNPEAYAERFRQLAEENRDRQMADANAMNELVENYRSTRSEVARQELLARLEADFERQTQQLQQQIKILED